MGGVVRLTETEMIGSEGEILRLPIKKCLDSEATCEVRIDQVSSSQVARKRTSPSPIGKGRLKSEFGEVGMKWNRSKLNVGPSFGGGKEGETKS